MIPEMDIKKLWRSGYFLLADAIRSKYITDSTLDTLTSFLYCIIEYMFKRRRNFNANVVIQFKMVQLSIKEQPVPDILQDFV
jgi:hypothetical protein